MAKVLPNALTKLTLALGLAIIVGSVSAQEAAKHQAIKEAEQGVYQWQTWGTGSPDSDVVDMSRLQRLPAQQNPAPARAGMPLQYAVGSDAVSEDATPLALRMSTSLALSANNDAEDEAAEETELALKLQNPVANLISVPLQNNVDFRIGPKDALRYTLNVQPVIPFSLNDNWNLITRTIVPIIYAEPPVAGAGYHSGTGDIVQSFFLSPVKLFKGWIWGAGPVFLWPTASNNALGGEKWGAGPTVVALRQEKGWTYGALANHIWSYAGDSTRQEVNATFLQPFVAYTTKTYTTVGLNTESTYDWTNDAWTVPFNLTVAQLLKIGKLPIQFQVGGRYYAARPAGGPDWGIRFTVTFLLPK
jgi:hypothetical protein